MHEAALNLKLFCGLNIFVDSVALVMESLHFFQGCDLYERRVILYKLAGVVIKFKKVQANSVGLFIINPEFGASMAIVSLDYGHTA